jgi:hypothetical protein
VKEGVETAGPTKPIKTSADGVRISEYLPLTAKQMHHGTGRSTPSPPLRVRMSRGTT